MDCVEDGAPLDLAEEMGRLRPPQPDFAHDAGGREAFVAGVEPDDSIARAMRRSVEKKVEARRTTCSAGVAREAGRRSGEFIHLESSAAAVRPSPSRKRQTLDSVGDVASQMNSRWSTPTTATSCGTDQPWAAQMRSAASPWTSFAAKIPHGLGSDSINVER